MPGAEARHLSPRLSRAGEIALRVAAVLLLATAGAALEKAHLRLLAQYLGLALVARSLRVPFGGTTLELEAAAIFPAVVLCRCWEAGPVLAALAVGLARLVERRGRITRRDMDEISDLTLAYGASCYFFISVGQSVEPGAPLTLLFGATLLVFFFARVVLEALHAVSDPRLPVPALVRAASYQLLALVLLSPIVALIVIVEPSHGFLGALLAFFSVALVSAALRNVASTRSRAAELARQNQELGTLREVSRSFVTAKSDDELFEKLLGVMKQTLPIRAFAAASYEDDPDGKPVATLKGDVTLSPSEFLEWLSRQRDLEAPLLTRTPQPLVNSRPERDLVLNAGLAYQVVLPLQTPELIAGVLVVESDDPSLIEPGRLGSLAVLADHVALSLQDRGLKRQMHTVNERLESRAATLYRILEVSNELKAHLSLDQVLVNIVRAVGNSLGFDVVLLSLYDRHEDVFERRAQVGLDATWEELARQKVPREEITRWFIEGFRIGKSYFVGHAERAAPEDTGWRRRKPGLVARSWHPDDLLLIPLTSSERLIGVLQVDQPKSGKTPRLEDVQALEIFANQAVTAIQSARAYETTRLMSVRDSLTDAFNHRHFQETLYRELSRHERTGAKLALVMLDIDDFKQINDRWGHPVGDLVLRGLVEELLKGVRDMDTVARYGGEEFAVILPDTTPEKAELVAERLRARVAAHVYLAPEASHPLSITISAGLATYPDDGASKRALIERADQALYQAKRSGKNCVISAASLSGAAA